METQRGFSLVELLIALLIFSFVAAGGVAALRLAVDARDQTAAADDEIRALETARGVLKRDLLQIVPRRARDAFGVKQPLFFYGGEGAPLDGLARDEQPIVAFVRRGWTNPDAAAPRSSLQHVTYLFRDGALIRRIRPYVDAARGQETAERILADGLNDARVEFLVGVVSGVPTWSQTWPTAQTRPAPIAVSLTLETSRLGAVRHMFLVGGVSE